jgi:hypothetical protein
MRNTIETHKEIDMSGKRIPVHLIFIGIHAVLAIVTLIPSGAASKVCLLGYRAHCTFTPISTIIFLALIGLHFVLHRRSATGQAK